MQLYTVSFDQLVLISKFEGKGKKQVCIRSEERTRVTHNAVPGQTADMYRRTVDKAMNLTIIPYEPDRKNGPAPKVDKQFKAAKHTARPAPVNKRAEAARNGDMSAALNQ